jgi:general secretion pathway protein D
MTQRGWIAGAVLAAMLLPAADAQVRQPAGIPALERARQAKAPVLSFLDADIDIVLEDYGEKTGRTILRDPKLPKAVITLRSQGDLSLDEYLEAIEAVLAMNGVAVLPIGDKFLRAVPIATARQTGMPIRETLGEDGLPESDAMVSQMIPLRNVGIEEIKAVLEPLKSPFGQLHLFERTNSILVTDTAMNVNRIIQVVQYVDQPAEAREEPNVVPIRYAKASEIKAKLEEILADQREEQRKKSTVPAVRTTGAPGVEQQLSTIPGVIRARRTLETEPEAIAAEIIEQAERGIIRGKVQIIADDRTNILIVITRPENMTFFEKIIQVLDVETEPDVEVQVFRLEFAESEKVAGMLNDLIGAVADEGGASPAKTGREGESAALREYVRRREQDTAEGEAGKSKVGQLSKDDIKILSDERTNSLIIMASRGDLGTLEEIIRDMDMMLSQVLIEAVILEVNLDDTLQTGVDWLQRAMISYKENADGTRSPVTAWAGRGGGGTLSPLDPTRLTTIDRFPGGTAGLSYYVTLFDLNLDTVLQLVATDSRTRILSSPVILTTDNKNATIDVSTEQYFYKGKKYVGGGDNPFYEDDVETKKVGIILTVTPRINERKFVVMEIEQTIDNVSGTQVINDQEWPIVTTRKLEATIAVETGETIVMGGLVQNIDRNTRSGVPLLSKIPLLGIPFRNASKQQGRNEVIVFITPYVLDTPEDILADAKRRRDAVKAGGIWEKGWSDSKLADQPRETGWERLGRRPGEQHGDSPPEEGPLQAEPEPPSGPLPAMPDSAPAGTAPPGPEPEAAAGEVPEAEPPASPDQAIRALLEQEAEQFGPALDTLDARAQTPSP